MSRKKDYSEWTKEQLIERIRQLEKRKKYGLVWDEERTKEEVVERCQRELPVLVGVPELDIMTDPNQPTHILIEGDNHHALSVLNYTHEKAVDVIYIDPPYNTGNKDFRYNDSYVDKEDGYRHSKWLSFMERRLRNARNLLEDDGILFISIGEDEIAQLKLLCNDIFGENNYIANFIWEKTQHFGRQKTNFYSNADYILCYGKELIGSGLKELLVESIKTEHEDAPLYNASNPQNTLTFPVSCVKFNIPDGEYSKTSDSKYYLMKSLIVENNTNANELVLRFKSRWSQRNVELEIKKGTTFWVKSDKFAIRAIYGIGKTSRESPKQIIFTNARNEHHAKSRFGIKVGVNEEASSELFNIIGEQSIFEYPKPRSLIEYLISLLFDKNSDKFMENLTVLDFFAGTGTTGHAVLNLNRMDRIKRQFILCTNNESNICLDICYPRLKRAITGYKNTRGELLEGLSGNLKYFRTDFVPSEPSDENRMLLTLRSVEMLCLRESTFDFVGEGKDWKHYRNLERNTFILFDQRRIAQVRKKIAKFDGPVAVYIFSLGDEDFAEEFVEFGGRVQVRPIPEAILRVYRRIFK